MGLAEELIGAVEDGAMDGLRVAAHAIAELAKRNVPVGDPAVDPNPDVSLRDSIHVEREGNGYLIVADTPYAAKQEFDMRLKHPRGGGARYLARARDEVLPTLDGIIASNVEGRMAAGLHGRHRRG